MTLWPIVIKRADNYWRTWGARLCLSAVIGLLITASFARPAQGQGQRAALARIQLLNTQAMEDYDSLEFDTAKQKLHRALAVAQQSGIRRGKPLARTYVHLGIVYGAGLNDRLAAVRYFTDALRLDPSLALDPMRATPALEEMFKTARDSAGPAPAPAAAIRHEIPKEVEAERRLVLRAAIAEPSAELRCALYYRSEGAPFVRVSMEAQRNGTCVGAVAAADVRPPTLSYYIELQDAEGARVGGSGTRAEPHVVDVTGGGAGSDGDYSATAKTLSIGLMVGSGGGVVFGGSSEHMHARVSTAYETIDIRPGFAPAPFHLAAQINFHLDDHWQVGVLGRFQVVNALQGDTVTDKGAVSLLGLARAKRYFGASSTRFFLSFGAGAGQIRHRVALGNYDPVEDPDGSRTPDDIIDSRVAGVGVFGFGGGFDFMFTDFVGLTLELDGLILVPDFAAHADLNLGLVLAF